jgi:MOSC domain-containing protein YiiM
MHVIATNIGRPREVTWDGKKVRTGIFKEPVDLLTIRKHYVEGDTVADPTVHGGERKAVYAYPSEHYPFWRGEFPAMEMPWGTFGENLTTEGLLESEAIVGSVYRVGASLLQVTQPRMPCFKLAAKFGTVTIIRRFVESLHSGIYFTVLEEGVVRPGDTITLEREGTSGVSILDVFEDRTNAA